MSEGAPASAGAARKEREWWQLGDQSVAGWFDSAQQSLFGVCEVLNVEWEDFSPKGYRETRHRPPEPFKEPGDEQPGHLVDDRLHEEARSRVDFLAAHIKQSRGAHREQAFGGRPLLASTPTNLSRTPSGQFGGGRGMVREALTEERLASGESGAAGAAGAGAGAARGAGAPSFHAAPWAGVGREAGKVVTAVAAGGTAWFQGAPSPLGRGAGVGARPGGLLYAKYETPEVESLGAGEFWASEVGPTTHSFDVERACGLVTDMGPRDVHDSFPSDHPPK